MRPEIRAEVDRIVAGFRRECLRVLGETESLRVRLAEPPEGWPEYFTRRIYTALLKYKVLPDPVWVPPRCSGSRGTGELM
jgi:hypothetical protein